MNNNFKYKNITLGSDPEFMIKNSKGKLISSIGLIHGTKDFPIQLKSLGDGFALQTDNVLGEFNIPVSFSTEEAVSNIELMKAYINGYLDTMNLSPLYIASGIYDDDQLQTYQAKQFGCSPDFNAWFECMNIKPNAENQNLRSVGCHVHIGYDNHGERESLNIVKALDLFLGVPSVLIDPDNQRRQLYGSAGCFRFTDFGCEYRVLSGYFISSKKLELWVFNQIYKAIEYLNENGIDEIQNEMENIVVAINTCDKNIANKLINKFNINLDYKSL